MGCISSKLLARSVSLGEEGKSRSRRKVNGIPVLEDLISANGNDQYLALVCAANAVANKLHSRSFSSDQSSKPATQHVETAGKCEISARLDQHGGKQIDIDLRKRSKSYHWFPEQVMSQDKSSSFQDECDLSSKDAVVRSRSFHTVEEYDAMLDRIRFSKSKSDKHQQSGVDLEEDNKSSAIKENSNNSSCGVEKRGEVPIQKPDVVETVSSASAAQGGSSIRKGNKRRAVAERLESLRIPSEKECPAIASLREWLPAGGIYSPGSYITPKFGSYSLTTGTNAYESNEGYIFSPELVSAFEQCMQNLQAQEENILKQIIQNLEEANGGDMQSQEATPP